MSDDRDSNSPHLVVDLNRTPLIDPGPDPWFDCGLCGFVFDTVRSRHLPAVRRRDSARCTGQWPGLQPGQRVTGLGLWQHHTLKERTWNVPIISDSCAPFGTLPMLPDKPEPTSEERAAARKADRLPIPELQKRSRTQ